MLRSARLLVATLMFHLNPLVPVAYGQDLVPVQPNEIAVAETPEKTKLRKQVSDLVDALQYEENMVHHEIHEVKKMLVLR